MKDYVVTAVIVAVICRVLPIRASDLESSCREVYAEIPTRQYDKLIDFTQKRDLDYDRQFWATTKGVGGTLYRFRISYRYLRLVQINRKYQIVTKEESLAVWKEILAQMGLTILSLFESIYAPILNLHHNAARKALTRHCQIMLLTTVMCSVTNGAKCLSGMSGLL